MIRRGCLLLGCLIRLATVVFEGIVVPLAQVAGMRVRLPPEVEGPVFRLCACFGHFSRFFGRTFSCRWTQIVLCLLEARSSAKWVEYNRKAQRGNVLATKSSRVSSEFS
jgi:hypothetical protein